VATVGLVSGCELIVGELPQAVDSVEEPGSTDSGASGGTGGRGTGGVAIGDTGGAAGFGDGGTSNLGGSVSGDGGPGGGAGTGDGSTQGGNGGSSDGGATSGTGGETSGGRLGSGGNSGSGGQVSTGGTTSTGGQVLTGGAQGNGGSPSTGGRVGSGGVAGTGGSPATGGSGACQSPPCDCDGDGGDAVGCNGGDDCDDADPLVYKNESIYYATPSLHRGFDYDCSGAPTRDPLIDKRQDCSVAAVTCNTTSNGFLVPIPECGATGDWGTCSKLLLPLGLTCSNSKIGTQQVYCK
jgi:hypothetical protein